MEGRRIVVIEDDRDIAKLVHGALREDGHVVEVVHDGVDGLAAALDADTELVVIDLMLPGMDGLEICRRLRSVRPELLVLMLTAKTSEFDRVLGLEMGADDYLTKPFSLRELQARVKALLRRKQLLGEAINAEPVIVHGPLTIDAGGQRVAIDGREIHLTGREFELLRFLARHPHQVYGRQELLDRIWGAGFDGFAHTVNSHINRLRTKVEGDPADPKMIQTVWGRGYKFVPPT
ncbi:MAG: response regulator transcription factor [Trueperaceae bacterium]|nr:response regulator transcription factor [Trueperaceae bacterium]